LRVREARENLQSTERRTLGSGIPVNTKKYDGYNGPDADENDPVISIHSLREFTPYVPQQQE
jgi:hypothetical protein